MPEKWKEAGRLSAEALKFAAPLVKPGARLLDVAEKTERFVRKQGADMAFPLVISINDVACHYTPDAKCERVFERGDLVKLDTGACIDGYVGDNAITVEVGNGNEHTELIKASREALETGLEGVRPGAPILAPAAVMSNVIRSYGFRTIENLTGHFVKRNRVHASPFIPSTINRWYIENCKGQFEEGQIATLEPFASTGSGWIVDGIDGNLYELFERKWPKFEELGRMEDFIYSRFGNSGLFTDRWCSKDFDHPKPLLKALHKRRSVHAYTASTEKVPGSLVSQAEVMFVVTSDGCEILT